MEYKAKNEIEQEIKEGRNEMEYKEINPAIKME